MDLVQYRCFLAAAETMHFGRAAQSLDMLPATLGRHIKNLEQRLGATLFLRTTRSVALTDAGAAILQDARALLSQAEALEKKIGSLSRSSRRALRIGAIDSAATGLVPPLLQFLREEHPDLSVQLTEQKSAQLIPRLLSGSLDLAFCRPPEAPDSRLTFRTLLRETVVVALHEGHALAQSQEIVIEDLASEKLIVPDRRVRPHSHDLTIKLFHEAGLTAKVAQIAEEKHTIVNLVATGTGLAILPRWTARLAAPGVRFKPLRLRPAADRWRLVLAAAWPTGARDPQRDALLHTLEAHLPEIEALA